MRLLPREILGPILVSALSLMTRRHRRLEKAGRGGLRSCLDPQDSGTLSLALLSGLGSGLPWDALLALSLSWVIQS